MKALSPDRRSELSVKWLRAFMRALSPRQARAVIDGLDLEELRRFGQLFSDPRKR